MHLYTLGKVSLIDNYSILTGMGQIELYVRSKRNSTSPMRICQQTASTKLILGGQPHYHDKDLSLWGTLGSVLPLLNGIFILKMSEFRRWNYKPRWIISDSQMYSISVVWDSVWSRDLENKYLVRYKCKVYILQNNRLLRKKPL